jgi:ribosomal protein S18 acetylase RimI-like enzyme
VYIFRNLTRDDLVWFVSVRNSVRQYLHDPRYFTVEEASLWFPTRTSCYWVVEADGLPIGYTRTRTFAAGSVEVGLDLCLQAQGRGHAKRIYRHLADLMSAQGTEHFVLRVLKSNPRARSLYLSLGFVDVPLLEGPLDWFMVANVTDLLAEQPWRMSSDFHPEGNARASSLTPEV